MGKKNILLKSAACVGIFSVAAFSQINISVDANAGIKKISPYIYGRNIDNNYISDTSLVSTDKEDAFIAQMLDAGIHMMRSNTGNNATRYNWRKKLTVHPDWYNNVYTHDWDITAKKVLDKMPGVDAMYAFQLNGYAAKTNEYNFADWDWYVEHGSNAKQTLDLAGGGEVSADGQTAIKEGDGLLYCEPWPADSTVGIVPHWRDELKYDMSRFQYWSMDNEMDIWKSSLSDLNLNITGDFLVERYIDVAKKARAAWGDIKLTGPVVANEWQWCHIAATAEDNHRPTIDGKSYCWLEFFIKKVAEAEKASGVRLLDVFDIHWYPTEKDYKNRINWHRVLYDTTYYYEGGNGVRCASGTCDWSNEIAGYKAYRSYIFVRINQWLEKYFGKDHGITLAITETDLNDSDPMVTALTYASFLGTMQDNGVEIFTPWSWGDGMYETVHLFSRYGHPNRVESVSSNDSLVSGYSSISNAGDSLTVIFVNRAESAAQNVELSLKNFKVNPGEVTTLTLSELKGETFVSHTQNALQKGSLQVSADGKASLSLKAKSITAVMFATNEPEASIKTSKILAENILNYKDGKWVVQNSSGQVFEALIFNCLGKQVKTQKLNSGNVMLSTENLNSGHYIVQFKTSEGMRMQKITLH